MKKYFLFSGLVVVLIACASWVLAGKSGSAPLPAAMPDDVQAVVRNSCMACHATGGKKMAMSIVNFSEWDNYSAEKQAKKASAICNVITKGSMPPKGYLNSNPGAAVTAAQKDIICNWSKSLQTQQGKKK